MSPGLPLCPGRQTDPAQHKRTGEFVSERLPELVSERLRSARAPNCPGIADENAGGKSSSRAGPNDRRTTATGSGEASSPPDGAQKVVTHVLVERDTRQRLLPWKRKAPSASASSAVVRSAVNGKTSLSVVSVTGVAPQARIRLRALAVHKGPLPSAPLCSVRAQSHVCRSRA